MRFDLWFDFRPPAGQRRLPPSDRSAPEPIQRYEKFGKRRPARDFIFGMSRIPSAVRSQRAGIERIERKTFLNSVKRLDNGGRGIVYLPRRSTTSRSYQHLCNRQLLVINIPFRLRIHAERMSREIGNGYQQSVKNFSTMTRVHLAQLLRDLLSPHGYHFFTAPDEYMPSEIDRYPAAWLTPPRLKEVEGRRHGKQVYELQLHLLQPGVRLTHDERARPARRNGADAARNLHGADPCTENHLRRPAHDPPAHLRLHQPRRNLAERHGRSDGLVLTDTKHKSPITL